MRRFVRRYIYWMLGTVLLGILCIYGLKETTFSELYFYFATNDETVQIFPYQAENGDCYVFLPSYVEMEDVHVGLSFGTQAALDDKNLAEGMDCGNFAVGEAYELSVNHSLKGTLQFQKSGNVATLFLNTGSGDMEHIHSDQANTEVTTATLVGADGQLAYYSDEAYLKGRGNATWNYEKKPYVLKLAEATDLLNMGAASDWILLANAADATNLRNKLVFDLAKQVDMAWSPDCAYVDVYLNGNYNGLYLLTEKVQSGLNRLELDVTEGDFLCKVDRISRWDTLENPMMSAHGRVIEISEPEYVSDEEKGKIADRIGEMERIIFSAGNIFQETQFHAQSWVYRYLIDEISGNIDSDFASSYFYSQNGVIYAGPVWDYDMTFGNSVRNYNPRTFVARTYYKSLSNVSSYYDALYHNPFFYQQMTQVYQEEFLPLLEALVDGQIQEMAGAISAASNMNRIRWNSMFEQLQIHGNIILLSEEAFIQYLEERVEFLNDAWINGQEYCIVQFELEPNQYLINAAIRKNDSLDTIASELPEGQWFDHRTGATVDYTQKVTQDMVLVKQIPTNGTPAQSDTVDTVQETGIATVYYVVIASILLLVMMCISMTGFEIYCRKTRRRDGHEGDGTKISP